MKYKYYTDGGHGWLAVKLSEVIHLGIATQISECSYRNGHILYLEEDCDMPLFLNAKKSKGQKYEITDIHQDPTPIRGYTEYQVPAILRIGL